MIRPTSAMPSPIMSSNITASKVVRVPSSSAYSPSPLKMVQVSIFLITIAFSTVVVIVAADDVSATAVSSVGNTTVVSKTTTEKPKTVAVLGNDDPRIAAAVCQLDCVERHGNRRVWPYDVDPRGIYLPSMTCPEESSGTNIAALRFARCQKCTEDCVTEEVPLNGIQRHLDVDHNLRLRKPALHCRSWSPVTSDMDELASIDPDLALAPTVYMKFDVVAAVAGNGDVDYDEARQFGENNGTSYAENATIISTHRRQLIRSSRHPVDGRPPVAFLLDIRKLLWVNEKDRVWSEWLRMGVSTSALIPINGLKAGHAYQWRVAAITVNRTILPWVTSEAINASAAEQAILERNSKPGPVANAYIYKWVRTDDVNNKMNAVLVWDPNPEHSCSYEVYFEFEGSPRMRNWRSEVFSANLAVLNRMEFSARYTFRIRAKNPLANSESDVHVFQAVSPACLVVYDNSFKFCPPPAPSDVRIFWDGDLLRVNWNLTNIATTENSIDSITVNVVEEFFPLERDTFLAAYRSYRSPRYGATPKIVLPGTATSTFFEGLPKTSAYKVWVRAETAGGTNDSTPVTLLPVVPLHPSATHDVSDAVASDAAVDQAVALSRSSSTWLAPLGVFVIVVIVVIGMLYVTRCRKTRGCLPGATSTSNAAGNGKQAQGNHSKRSGASFSRVSTHDVDCILSAGDANRLNNNRRVDRSCSPTRRTYIATSNEYDDAMNGKGKAIKKWFSFKKQKSVILGSGTSTTCVSPTGTEITEINGSAGSSVFSGYLRPVNGVQTHRFQTLRFFGERVLLTSAMSLSPADDYEVCWDQVILQEVLGEGAFGVVRKAQLKLTHENRLKLLHKNAPLKSIKMDSKQGAVIFETVAVKMLKDGAGMEEYQQLKNEMEVLKMIHHHPNVVGIVGAITQARPMALIVQHCPFGDLHTQLRRLAEELEREKSFQKEQEKLASVEKNSGIVYATFDRTLSMDDLASQESVGTLGSDLAGSPATGVAVHNEMYGGNDADSTNEIVSAGNKRLSSMSSASSAASAATLRIGFSAPPSRPMSPMLKNQNGDADVDKSKKLSFSCDDEMRTPADLLSIARQIAAGMEYLAKNKVVHRDLAARNILLYEPKHVKISDFGLSRDVYARNLYERTSNGKVPIRWMAPESILHQIYTTKSDVWSFGILLWEIATLGGIPYPGIAPGSLFNLLQQGYIMPKPNNCSNDLYGLMVICWQLAAADRPTFTELKDRLEKMLEDSTTEQYLTLNADPIPREETD